MMFKKGEKVLAIAAHPDDIEMGVGGTLARFRDLLDIKVLVLSQVTRDSAGNVQIQRDMEELHNAMKVLGICDDDLFVREIPAQLFQRYHQEIREEFLKWKREFNPDIILCPGVGDIHQDHSVVLAEAERIFRERTILGFEIIRSSLHMIPQMRVEITEEQLARKIEAISCYKSQLDPAISAAWYFSEDVIRSVARVRGAQVGVEYAEAFAVKYIRM